jgi:hypothetical protein
MLLQRIPKKPKRSSRWRSTAHCNHVRKHACVNCGTVAAIEVAHVRIGSDAGIGRKPSDDRSVPLCRDCHRDQHTRGERSFWADYASLKGHTVEDVIAELVKTSPRRLEIEQVRRERNG